MPWYITDDGYFVSGAGDELSHLPEPNAEYEGEDAEEEEEDPFCAEQEDCDHCIRANTGRCKFWQHQEEVEDAEPDMDDEEI